MTQLTNGVMFLLFLGSVFYSFYLSKDAIELSKQIKSFCNEDVITDMRECLHCFKLKDENTNIESLVASLHTYETKIRDMSKTIAKLGNTTDQLIKSNQRLNNEVNKSKSLNLATHTKLQALIDEFNTATKENVILHTLETELIRQSLNISTLKGYQEYADSTKANKDTFAVVSIILGLGELIIIVLLCSRKSKHIQQGNVTDPRQGQHGDYRIPNNAQSILDGIQRRNDLENSLCVVSFIGQTETEHCEMVNSFIDKDIHKRSYIVNRAGDLKEMPLSMICVVFVDYNSRNIILESEYEFSELKKTTVKAIWKMGGDVILVYCGDELSKVSGTELYNRRLVTIENQEELKQLDSKKRVLSVYKNTFTEHQKQHLRNLTGWLKRA